MIRNVVLHPIGDQPMLADLVVRPQASDSNLLLTNLRTMDGKRPPAIEHPDGVLIWPLATIRFLEVPAAELAADGVWPPAAAVQSDGGPSDDSRIEGNGHAVVPLYLPVPGADLTPVEPEPDLDEDASEELLRRIREL